MRSADPPLPQERFQLHLWRARYPAGVQTGGRLAEPDLLRLGRAGLGVEAGMVWAARFQDDTLDLSVEATPCCGLRQVSATDDDPPWRKQALSLF